MRQAKSTFTLIFWLLLFVGAIGLWMVHDKHKQNIENIMVAYARLKPFERNIEVYYREHRSMPKPEQVFQTTELTSSDASCHLAGHCPVYYSRFGKEDHRAYLSVMLEQKETSERLFKAYVGDPKTGQVTVFCGPWQNSPQEDTVLEQVYPQCQSNIKKVLGF